MEEFGYHFYGKLQNTRKMEEDEENGAFLHSKEEWILQ